MRDLTALHWMGDTLDRVRRFSAEARADIGYQLKLVQSSEMPTDFRPMPDVGPGAMEIRVHAGSEYRVSMWPVVRKRSTCCIALTQKTRDADIELGQRRYRAAMEWRKHEGYNG